MKKVSVIVPAYNEEDYLGETLQALRKEEWLNELIVINDGSIDKTEDIANKYSDVTIYFSENVGKGRALQAGWQKATGDIIVMLDADLGKSVTEAKKLLEPLQYPYFDFTIARFPAKSNNGFGFMKRRAQRLIFQKTGHWVSAPLSGQRAVRRNWLTPLIEKNYYRFSVETLMTIDLLQAGAALCEVDTKMSHRQTGKDIQGFFHRGMQWLQLERSVREMQS